MRRLSMDEFNKIADKAQELTKAHSAMTDAVSELLTSLQEYAQFIKDEIKKLEKETK